MKKEAYKEAWWIPTVKHGGVGTLYFISGTMNADPYCDILEKQKLFSLREIGRRAHFQNLKHAVQKTWPNMAPDMNPIET